MRTPLESGRPPEDAKGCNVAPVAPRDKMIISGSQGDFLSYLQQVRKISEGRYTCLCPCHDDTRPSFNVTITPEGKILAYCYACGAKGHDACQALKLPLSILFPQENKFSSSIKSGKFPAFSAFQFFVSSEKDTIFLHIIVQDLMNGKEIQKVDAEELAKVMVRFNQAVDVLREGYRNE